MSTALTSTAPTPLHPVEIVGMSQFRPGMQRRFGADVSTMVTDTPQSLGTILCPTVKPPHVAGVRSRDFSLHSHTRPPALHEGGAPLHEHRVYSMGVGGSCSTHNPRPVPPAPRAVGARDKATDRTLYPEVRTPPGRRPHMPDPSTELEELRRRSRSSPNESMSSRTPSTHCRSRSSTGRRSPTWPSWQSTASPADGGSP